MFIGPVTPVDVALEHRHREHVHVVVGQHHFPVFSGLQVDALYFVRPGIAPVQQTLLPAHGAVLYALHFIVYKYINMNKNHQSYCTS